MTAFAGMNTQLRIGDGAQPQETFMALSGVQLERMSLQRKLLDALSLSDTQWSRSAEGGSVMMRIEASGVYTDSAAELRLWSHALTGASGHYELEWSNGDVVSGAFRVSAYERQSDVRTPESYRVTLESTGSIAYLAAS